MIGKGVLIVAGSVCILAGLFLTLIVVGMFQRPGGMGVEKLLGPIMGVVALGLILLGGICLYIASRLGTRRLDQ